MKAFSKDFCREFFRNRGRFISVFFIVMLGAAFFSGIRSSKSAMHASANKYYHKTKLMDIKIQGELGITDKDINDISHIMGIEKVEGGHYVEAICKIGSKQEEIKVIGTPKHINLHTLIEGKEPTREGECLVDHKFLDNTGYKIGDFITLESGTSESIYKQLKYNQYKIVGICSLPYYMDVYRDYTSIGDGQLDSFIVVNPKVMKSDIYTEMSIRVSESKKYSAYDDNYKDIINQYVTSINGLKEMACNRRYNEVYSEADNKIKDAEKELKDAQDELDDARDKINDGEKEIKKAKNTLLDKEKELKNADTTIKDKEKEINNAKKLLKSKKVELENGKSIIKEKEVELVKGKNEIKKQEEQLVNTKQIVSDKEKKLQEGKVALLEGKEQINIGKNQIKQGYDLYKDKINEYNTLKSEFESIKSTLDSNEIASKEAEFATNLAILTKEKEELDAKSQELAKNEVVLSKTEEELIKGEKEISAAKEMIVAGEKELYKAKEIIVSGEKEISKAKDDIVLGEKEIKKADSQIISGEKEITKAKAKIKSGKKSLMEAKKQLKDKENELNDAKETFKKEEKKAVKLINEGKDKIKDSKKELAKIEVPEWYVTTREDIRSCKSYDLDAQRVSNLGDVFPLIFFMVAALVSLTAMTRMVEEQRQQIGILKALGYGRKNILKKYLSFAILPTLTGSIIGVLVGEKLLPLIVIEAYNMLYTGLTEIYIPYNWEYGGMAIIICVTCVCLATLMASFKATRTKPSELMRPKAPKIGKRVWLEKCLIWKMFNFSAKATFRNIFRYKKRLIMTVVGVGGCMGLILVALGLNDSILTIASEQFQRISRYEATVYLDDDLEDADKKSIYNIVLKEDRVTDALQLRHDVVKINKGKKEKDIDFIIPNDTKKIEKYILFNDRVTHEEYGLPKEGAIISEKTAEELGAKVGDSVQLKIDKKKKVSIKIKYIMENYLGDYLYMSKEQYKKLYKEDIKVNQFYVKLDDISDKVEKKFGKNMMKKEEVVGIWFMSDNIETVDGMLDALTAVVYVLLISAGLLAFIVLYNLNNINIAERHRELATLKVLGFYDGEVTQYVFRENIILTLLGIVVGVFMGKYLHQYVIKSIAMEGVMFGLKISLTSYIIGGIITIVFATIVNIIMSKSLKQIDMIESLKSVE